MNRIFDFFFSYRKQKAKAKGYIVTSQQSTSSKQNKTKQDKEIFIVNVSTPTNISSMCQTSQQPPAGRTDPHLLLAHAPRIFINDSSISPLPLPHPSLIHPPPTLIPPSRTRPSIPLLIPLQPRSPSIIVHNIRIPNCCPIIKNRVRRRKTQHGRRRLGRRLPIARGSCDAALWHFQWGKGGGLLGGLEDCGRGCDAALRH